jgi:hypothetical protein
MMARRAGTSMLAVVVAATALLSGCSNVITGAPTWPGARLEKAVLTAADFPPGVDYGRVIEEPGQPGGPVGPAAMPSVPAGCSNGLTEVIARSGERGPGSAARYTLGYDGARIVMAVLTWRLDTDELANTASRCAHFSAYFDPSSEGIPITTTKLAGARPGQLLYQQTMRLNNAESSIFMSFENFDRMAVFGLALPTTQLEQGQPALPKASLPQTFIDVVKKQADKVRSN